MAYITRENKGEIQQLHSTTDSDTVCSIGLFFSIYFFKIFHLIGKQVIEIGTQTCDVLSGVCQPTVGAQTATPSARAQSANPIRKISHTIIKFISTG